MNTSIVKGKEETITLFRLDAVTQTNFQVSNVFSRINTFSEMFPD